MRQYKLSKHHVYSLFGITYDIKFVTMYFQNF